MSFDASSEIKDVTMEAVVIRADGTREELGVVSRLEPTPSLADRLKRLIGRN